MYKILKTDLSLVYAYSNFSEIKLTIKNNINEFYNVNQDTMGFYSLKNDEISLTPKAR
jgi:hypothetical protein